MFVDWLRNLNVDEAVLFEPNDLVLFQDGEDNSQNKQRNVLYSLMELGRVQTGVTPPRLVQIERRMNAGAYVSSLSEEERLGLLHDIDTLLKRMKKDHLTVSQDDRGDFKFGPIGPYKVARVRGRIMVRLPNSWDTLEHVLLSQDKDKPGRRIPRRNSLVQETVDERERRLSISQALSQRRPPSASGERPLSRSASRASADGTSAELEMMQEENRKLEACLEESRDESAQARLEMATLSMRVRELEAELQDMAEDAEQRGANEDEVARLRRELDRLREENEGHSKQYEDELAALRRQVEELTVRLESAV